MVKEFKIKLSTGDLLQGTIEYNGEHILVLRTKEKDFNKITIFRKNIVYMAE